MNGLKCAVIALYVGLAVAVLGGVHLAREVDKINAGIDKLVKPKPIVGADWWKEDPDGRAVNTRDVRVSSPIVLEGLEIRIRGAGIEEVRLLAANDKNPRASITKAPDNWWVVYIQHPFGAYRVEAVYRQQAGAAWFSPEFIARF